ncbi:unnamed protein product [Amoebophrya sp. A25]|nr:unnamed protein product [Amoebophrya sp. A25]|eukprot:GSA25T00011914001.1
MSMSALDIMDSHDPSSTLAEGDDDEQLRDVDEEQTTSAGVARLAAQVANSAERLFCYFPETAASTEPQGERQHVDGRLCQAEQGQGVGVEVRENMLQVQPLPRVVDGHGYGAMENAREVEAFRGSSIFVPRGAEWRRYVEADSWQWQARAPELHRAPGSTLTQRKFENAIAGLVVDKEEALARAEVEFRKQKSLEVRREAARARRENALITRMQRSHGAEEEQARPNEEQIFCEEALDFGPSAAFLESPLPLVCSTCFEPCRFVCPAQLHRYCEPAHKKCDCTPELHFQRRGPLECRDPTELHTAFEAELAKRERRAAWEKDHVALSNKKSMNHEIQARERLHRGKVLAQSSTSSSSDQAERESHTTRTHEERENVETRTPSRRPLKIPYCPVCFAAPCQECFCTDCYSVAYCSALHQQQHRELHVEGFESLQKKYGVMGDENKTTKSNSKSIAGVEAGGEQRPEPSSKRATGTRRTESASPTVDADLEVLEGPQAQAAHGVDCSSLITKDTLVRGIFDRFPMLLFPTCKELRGTWQAKRQHYRDKVRGLPSVFLRNFPVLMKSNGDGLEEHDSDTQIMERVPPVLRLSSSSSSASSIGKKKGQGDSTSRDRRKMKHDLEQVSLFDSASWTSFLLNSGWVTACLPPAEWGLLLHGLSEVFLILQCRNYLEVPPSPDTSVIEQEDSHDVIMEAFKPAVDTTEIFTKSRPLNYKKPGLVEVVDRTTTRTTTSTSEHFVDDSLREQVQGQRQQSLQTIPEEELEVLRPSPALRELQGACSQTDRKKAILDAHGALLSARRRPGRLRIVYLHATPDIELQQLAKWAFLVNMGVADDVEVAFLLPDHVHYSCPQFGDLVVDGEEDEEHSSSSTEQAGGGRGGVTDHKPPGTLLNCSRLLRRSTRSSAGSDVGETSERPSFTSRTPKHAQAKQELKVRLLPLHAGIFPAWFLNARTHVFVANELDFDSFFDEYAVFATALPTKRQREVLRGLRNFGEAGSTLLITNSTRTAVARNARYAIEKLGFSAVSSGRTHDEDDPLDNHIEIFENNFASPLYLHVNFGRLFQFFTLLRKHFTM